MVTKEQIDGEVAVAKTTVERYVDQGFAPTYAVVIVALAGERDRLATRNERLELACAVVERERDRLAAQVEALQRPSPGPWKWDAEDHSRNVLRAANGDEIGFVDEAIGTSPDTRQANRNLIASAPALAAQVAELVAVLKRCWSAMDNDTPEDVAAAAEVVLAKHEAGSR